MEIPAASIAETTQSLRFFMELIPSIMVNEQNYLYEDTSGKRLTMETKDGPRPIMLFCETREKDPFVLINPYAEGMGDRTPSQIYFYQSMRMAVATRLTDVITSVITRVLEQKKPDASPLPSEVLRIAGAKADDKGKTVFDLIDDKMPDEVVKFLIQLISADRKTNDARMGLVNLKFSPLHKTTSLEIRLLTDDGFVKDQRGIRPKTIGVIQAIIRAALKIETSEELSQFVAEGVADAAPKLSSTLVCMSKVFSRINLLLDQVGSELVVDQTALDAHISNLPRYTKCAKWLTQQSTPQASAAPQAPVASPLAPQSAAPPVSPTNGAVPPGYARVPGTDPATGKPTMVLVPVNQPANGMMPPYGQQGYPPPGYPPVPYGYAQQQPMYPQQMGVYPGQAVYPGVAQPPYPGQVAYPGGAAPYPGTYPQQQAYPGPAYGQVGYGIAPGMPPGIR